MTMQSSDRLLWQGQRHVIVSSLDAAAIFPEVAKTNFIFLETSCWRGYEATWMIGDDNYLRIKYIEGVINGLPNNNNIGKYEYEPEDQIYSIFPTHDTHIRSVYSSSPTQILKMSLTLTPRGMFSRNSREGIQNVSEYC